MTTMFIQLRRVVYLLVLLQCSLYVECVNAEFEQAWNRLLVLVKEVDGRSLVRGKWLEERRSALEACEKNYKEAETVVNDAKILMDAIKEKVNGETIPDSLSPPQADVVELVSRAIVIIPSAGNASAKCVASYKKAQNTERLCTGLPEGIKQDLQDFKEALKPFESVNSSEGTTDENEKELLLAYETYYKLSNVSQDFTSLDAKRDECYTYAEKNGKEANDAKTKLIKMIGNHGETVKQLQQQKEQEMKAAREQEEAEQKKRNEEREKADEEELKKA
ncbi:uncharacterized protein TM35_000061030, partial [Trypanosoma theileri]